MGGKNEFYVHMKIGETKLTATLTNLKQLDVSVSEGRSNLLISIRLLNPDGEALSGSGAPSSVGPNFLAPEERQHDGILCRNDSMRTTSKRSTSSLHVHRLNVPKGFRRCMPPFFPKSATANQVPAGRILTAAELVPVLVETKDRRLAKLQSRLPGYSPLQVVPLLGFAMEREPEKNEKRITRLQFKLGEKAPDGTAGVGDGVQEYKKIVTGATAYVSCPLKVAIVFDYVCVVVRPKKCG